MYSKALQQLSTAVTLTTSKVGSGPTTAHFPWGLPAPSLSLPQVQPTHEA